MKLPKVLIVDDDDELRRLLGGLLSPVCEVLDASNGIDALCLLQRARPRLILLDLAMPEMDGLEVLSAALRLAPAVQVVMLTGETDVSSAVRALNKGASAYVTKPFDPAYLREEVVRLLAPSGRPGGAPWQVRDDA
jgi:two-component system, NtrC family, response regulator AtoC